MSRRAGRLALGVMLSAVVLSLGAVVLTRGPGCPVQLEELERRTGELVPPGELAPVGSVGEERRPVVEAIGELGGPFGDVVAGRFYPEGVAPPVLVPFGEDVLLAEGGPGGGDFLAVDLPEGSLHWGRRYAGGAARGGLVADTFVVAVGGADPAVLSLGADDGEPIACAAVPVSGAAGEVTTLLTDQAATDVVVVAGPPAAAVTLSRIAPLAGGVVWEQELTGLVEAGSVTVVGATAVVSRLGVDPVRLADMATAGGIGSPMVRAYSLADGTETWSHPSEAAFASTAASVVGSAPGSETVVVMTAREGRSSSAKATVVRLVALDADGTPMWRSRVGRGYWSASLWGDLVVAQGAGRDGGAQLRAHSLTDGELRWVLESTGLASLGERPRTNFGPGTPVGDSYVVPAPNGLLLVDPLTGETVRLDSEVAVDQVLAAGDHLVVRTREALLVLEHVS